MTTFAIRKDNGKIGQLMDVSQQANYNLLIAPIPQPRMGLWYKEADVTWIKGEASRQLNAIVQAYSGALLDVCYKANRLHVKVRYSPDMVIYTPNLIEAGLTSERGGAIQTFTYRLVL